jgi:hypothetical protein
VNKMSEKSEEMPDNETDQPLVTFALFAYNQEKYIREAVEGAFAQTYEPIEVILSEDYSTDRTFEIPLCPPLCRHQLANSELPMTEDVKAVHNDFTISHSNGSE